MSGSYICGANGLPSADASALIADKGAACVVRAALEIMADARRLSCGQCVFCREGTIQLHELLKDGTSGSATGEDLELLAEIAVMVRDYSGCEMSSKAAGALVDLMGAYPDEFDQHFRRGRCPALACPAYYTVHVLPDLCTGCGACVQACPEAAIAGGDGMIRVIDGERCSRCGRCLEACDGIAKAIVKAGPVKPRTPDAPIPVGSWADDGGGRRRRRRGQENPEGGVE